MKKVAAIIAVVVVAAAAAVGVVMYRQGKSPTELMKGLTEVTPAAPEQTLASFVPQDAVAYIGVYDLKNNWKLFKSSNTWKEITALQLWQDIEFEQALADFQQQFQAQTGIELSESNFMELFGRQFAVTLFMKNDRQVEPSVMLLAQVGTKTRILSGLIGLTEQAEGPYETTEYNGVKIYTAKATPENPTDMSFAVVKDVLVMEIGQATKNITAVIDMVKSDGAKGALAQNMQFKEVTDAVNGPYLQELFVNAREILNKLDQTTLPEALQDEGIRNSLRSSLATMQVIGGASKLDNGIYSRLTVVPNFNTDNEQLRKLWDAQPKKSRAMRMVPKDAILFNSSQSLDFSTLWNVWQESIITQDVDQANAIMSSINALETNLGISLKNDVFPVLDDEVAYVLTDLSLEGFIPIPKAGIILAVKDAAQADAMMRKVITAINDYFATTDPQALPMLSLDSTTYMDVPVTRAKITALPIAGLTPSYMVMGDMLVIATNSMTLEEMVRVARGKQDALTASENYRMIDDVITERNNQMSYINIERTVKTLVDVCGWLIDLQRSTGEVGELDQETIALITNNLIPFVNTFNSIKALGANTVYTKTGIEKTIVYRVEDF